MFENRLRFDKVTESLKVATFFRHSVCIRKMTKTVRYSCCHKLENNQTEAASRMFQFNHRDLDGLFEGEIKTKKICMTKNLMA